ncbi:MAG: hypothetical protein NT062_25415 [Proteobacteria bacterium]|nr:hypothetical protein [Pseudomonadota bacterium]
MPILIPLLLAIGCGEAAKPKILPPKRPNDELVVGEFERHPPQGTMAMRFRANGAVTVAKDRAGLDRPPVLGDGTYEVGKEDQKDQMTLTFETGDMCTPEQKGVYKVVISKLGLRFTKVEDDCEARARFDGTTFWRVH